MIDEIAMLTIDPAQSAAFEAAVAEAAPLFRSAEGCHAMRLERVIEDKARYRLVVRWDSVDHHMLLFRQSAAYAQWRAMAAPFFTAPPVVDHADPVARYF